MTTISSTAGAVETTAEVAGKRRCVMQITWSLVAGGAETYALTVASGLDKSKYRSVMCGVDQGGALEGEISRRRIPYHILNRRDGIDVGLFWRMFKLFRREHVDVIHTHHFNQLFYSILAAKVLGIRIIHTEHSVEAYKRRRLRWALWLMSFMCHKVTAIGVDGENTLLRKVGISRKKLQIIRAAVDLDRFKLDAAAARKELGITDADRVISIVARLYPEKKHILLLRAFARVLAKVPGAKLLIVGEGTEREAIMKEVGDLQIQRNVMVMGVRRDIPEILAASDICVLCSDREGLPISVLEAMAASRAVVATSVGDLPLVVKDGKTGLLVESGNEVELADAMTRLLQDPGMAKRLGAAGRALIEQDYSLDLMVQRHSALYGLEVARA